MFLCSEYDSPDWNREKSRHRHAKCVKPCIYKVIADRKAEFLQNKRIAVNFWERVLQEMAEGLQELVDLADSGDRDSTTTTFFQDFSASISTNSWSEAEKKGVGHALADIHIDDDSDL